MPRLATYVMAASFLIAPALSGAAESGETPEFASADANDDGVVSVNEAVDAGVPEEEAKREDIDGDGELTEADWKFVDMSPEEGQSAASGDG